MFVKIHSSQMPSKILPFFHLHILTFEVVIFVGRYHSFLQGMQALKVSRSTALLFLGPWHQMGVGGQPHALAASTPGKNPVPIVQEAGWAPRAGLDGRKIFFQPGFDPRSPSPQSVAILTELPSPQLFMLHTHFSSRFQAISFDLLLWHSTYMSLTVANPCGCAVYSVGLWPLTGIVGLNPASGMDVCFL